jgi:hypothetical protein
VKRSKLRRKVATLADQLGAGRVDGCCEVWAAQVEPKHPLFLARRGRCVVVRTDDQMMLVRNVRGGDFTPRDVVLTLPYRRAGVQRQRQVGPLLQVVVRAKSEHPGIPEVMLSESEAFAIEFRTRDRGFANALIRTLQNGGGDASDADPTVATSQVAKPAPSSPPKWTRLRTVI